MIKKTFLYIFFTVLYFFRSFSLRSLGYYFVLFIFLFFGCSCQDKQKNHEKYFMPIDDVYFYKDFPSIKGYTSTTTGENLALFTISIILVYPAKNRRIAPEISRRQLVIVDNVRNQLERFPESSFIGNNFDTVKKSITERINDTLINGKIVNVLVNSVDVYPVPDEFSFMNP